MNLSRLADPESPEARVAAVAVLGALLVGGCSLAGDEDLASSAATTAAQVADEQRTAKVRQTVQCDLAEPTTQLARPTATDPKGPAPASASARAPSPRTAVEHDPSLPDLTWNGERQLTSVSYLYSSTYRGKVRAAVTVIREGNEWSWDTAAWCDQAEQPAASDASSGVFVWTNKAGARISTRTVHTVRLDRSTQECYGELVSIVVVDGIRYVFDPLHSFTGTTHGTYRDGVTLPQGATDTGLRSQGATLWRTDQRDYVYLVDGANKSRLPREKSAPVARSARVGSC